MLPRSYTSPLAILAVDDEPVILQVLETTLRADGHVVATAPNGMEGLARFREQEWDVVLTDRAMPEMNGDQMAAAIKELSPRTPIVMITGTPPRTECSVVDVIITKPFSRAALTGAITQALANCARLASSEDYSAAA